jgi:glutamine amidotransferase
VNVAIIDYGAGNLTSLKAAFMAVGADSVTTRDAHAIGTAARIVVPGVGNFASTAGLRNQGLDQVIRDVAGRGVPLLGICLGMQWLFEGSEEAPGASGLGLFRGCSERFPQGIKTPHVGWNQIQQRSTRSQLLRGVPDSSFAYFTHSYRICNSAETVATADYAGEFSAVVEAGKVFGVQFHPEKSSSVGLTILRNFCSLTC